MSTEARFFSCTRFFTGSPVVRAYVYDRRTGQVVKACPHRHRKASAAERCSVRLLRRFSATMLCVQCEGRPACADSEFCASCAREHLAARRHDRRAFDEQYEVSRIKRGRNDDEERGEFSLEVLRDFPAAMRQEIVNDARRKRIAMEHKNAV